MVLDPHVFKVQKSLARCMVCPAAPWMKLSNAAQHATSLKHKLNIPDTVKTKKHTLNYVNAEDEHPGFANDDTFPMDECYTDEETGDMTSFHAMADILQSRVDLGLFTLPDGEELALNESTDSLEYGDDPREEYCDDLSEICDSSRILDDHVPAIPGEWYPYPSKAMFLTDLLFNSPHLRFSVAQKKAVLKWANDLGAQDVPKLHALEALQERLSKSLSTPTIEKRSRKGNIFFVNQIGTAIAKDISNPLVRPHMNFYPEDAQGSMSELWHASKWLRDLPDDMLTPMVVHPVTHKHFYIRELTKSLQTGQWFIPLRWFCKKDAGMWAVGLEVSENETGLVVQRERTEHPLATLVANYEEVIDQRGKPLIFAECSADWANVMPNPLCAEARGRPFYFVPVIVFVDDVSGNVSKQWNKHFVCYISNGALPRQQIDQQFNVRFVATSPSVGPLELIQGIRESFQDASEPGIAAYDCVLEMECLTRPVPFIFAADNPMQSDECSHSGLTANKYCKTCHAGGTQEFKRSEEGYLSLFKAAAIRTPQDTCDQLTKQFTRALAPSSRTALEKMVRESGVKDSISQPIIESLTQLGNELCNKSRNITPLTATQLEGVLNAELQRMKGMGPVQNPLLEMNGVDIHLDTPTEILHTILLGVVKYFWGQSVYLIAKDKKLDIFQARLESLTSDGLNIPKIAASYMCQYRGSLIGKHFKTIVQVIPHVVYDLVPKNLLDAWLLAGRLVVLCWHTEIVDTKNFLEELQDVIDQLLTATALCAPSIIVTKPKFHLLVHLPLYIQRFGPPLLFSTERYESFNTIFRLCSVHSNRAAPSRDIANTFAHLDRVKHIVTGGWWYDTQRKRYTCASKSITTMILHNAEYSHLLGLRMTHEKDPGTVALALTGNEEGQQRARKLPPINWSQTAAGSNAVLKEKYLPTTTVLRGRSIITKSMEEAKLGSAVICHDALGEFRSIILIKEILVVNANSMKDTVVVGNDLCVEANRHALLDFPRLTLTDDLVCISPEDVICIINMQHDCSFSRCAVSGTRAIRQERKQTCRTHPIVAHQDSKHYIWNTTSLHNYKHIALFTKIAVPPPQRYYADHTPTRSGASALLRDKKRQAQEAKEAKEREVIMGRGMAPQVQSGQVINPNSAPETMQTELHSHTLSSISVPAPPLAPAARILNMHTLQLAPVHNSTPIGFHPMVPSGPFTSTSTSAPQIPELPSDEASFSRGKGTGGSKTNSGTRNNSKRRRVA